jgi:16S rRNA (guanine527-N7)-methyltransferase
MTQRSISAFLDLFVKWNQQINLSAARSRSELDEHVQDSMAVVPLLRGSTRVVDVGSGGGFPVAIAAIELPDTQFVALEPVHKKHAFLRTVKRELGLENFDPRAERVEDHAVHDYDVAMSRATFDLAEWLARGLELVRGGGRVLGFEAIERELAISVERVPYELGGKSRAIVIATR